MKTALNILQWQVSHPKPLIALAVPSQDQLLTVVPTCKKQVPTGVFSFRDTL